MSAPVCFRCEEPILPGEEAAQNVHFFNADGTVTESAWHHECALRSIIGSVGHLRGTCSCNGGTEEDPPEMSRREAARAAVAEWERRKWSPPRGCA
jgi:hypothetical protein